MLADIMLAHCIPISIQRQLLYIQYGGQPLHKIKALVESQ